MLRFCAVMLLVFAPIAVQADEYIVPTRLSLIQTMFRFGALDINNDLVVDDYAKVAECELFAAFNKDDFRWQKIREGLRTKIRDDVVAYPTNYYVKGFVNLGRYDFDNKIYRITSTQRISSVNAFVVGNFATGACGAEMKMMPFWFYAVLPSQINIPGFVMDEADAKALLARLTDSGNTTRQLVTKFNLRVIGIDKTPLDYSKVEQWNDSITWVGKVKELRMDSRLDSVEFYEDTEMTKRIYIYRPGN